MLNRFLWGTLYGLASAMIAGGTAITVLPGMPDGWGWVKLAAGAGVAFAFGVFSYMRDPERAWEVASPGVGKP
jgi:hypothetical protein